MKKLYLCLSLMMLWSVSAFAQPKQETAEPFHDWVIYYYINKDSSKMPEFLTWLQSTKKLDKFPDAIPSVEGFLRVVFSENPSEVKKWSHAAVFTGKTKAAVHYAATASENSNDEAITSSADLDRAWGAYFASGDEKYLKKIVAVMENKEQGKKQTALHAAAALSLGLNMTQHESVDRFMETESANRSDAVGDELKQIVAGVIKQRDERAFPNRDGEFSALMFVTDPKIAQQELTKNSDGILHFKEMTHAKIGDNRAVVIVFSGMKLTADYMADVSYALQITDPKGKVFTDQKNLDGIKSKLPTRFRVFNNSAVVFVNFDSKDTPGVYKITAVLTDNVGQKSIKLASQITFDK